MINVSFNPLHNNEVTFRKQKSNKQKQIPNEVTLPTVTHQRKSESSPQTQNLNEQTFQHSQLYLKNISHSNKNAMNQYHMTFHLEKAEQIKQLIGFSEYA